MELPNKLNICFIARGFVTYNSDTTVEPGFVWALSKELISLGHQVTIIALANDDSSFVKNDIKCVLVKKPKLSKKSRVTIYEKFLEIHQVKPFNLAHIVDQYGILVAKNRKQNKLAIALDARVLSISQLFYIVGMTRDTLRSMLTISLAVLYKYLSTYISKDRKLLKNANGVFVSSPRQRLVLERYYFYPDRKIFTIPFGIELGVVYSKHETKYDIPDDTKVALTVVDMNHASVVKNILKAFESVVIKEPNTRLVIVGDGRKRRQIEKKMYNLALGSKVILTGDIPHSEIVNFVNRSDIFIDISIKSTGFDPAMLEAMANKKIVIGSEVSAISSIIENGVNGFLIGPSDTHTLSELMLKIFREQIDIAQIGERAKETIVPLFDPKSMVSSTIEAYHQMLLSSKLYKRT